MIDTKEEGSEGFLETSSDITTAEQELEDAIRAERPEDLAPDPEGEEAPETTQVPDEVPEDETADKHDWKTRYGNLRRYVQKELDGRDEVISTLKGDMTTLQGQMERTTSATSAALPETDEDLEALKTENPGAYNSIIKIATGIADKVVKEHTAGLQSEVDVINTRNRQSVEDAAAVALQKLHPRLDLATLGTEDKFMEWLGTIPKSQKDALTINKQDVETASFVLRSYEREVLDADPNRIKDALVKDVREASRDVKTSAASDPSAGAEDKGYDFLESAIERMSPNDFEKNADAIEKAYRSNRVLMDKSGASSN